MGEPAPSAPLWARDLSAHHTHTPLGTEAGAAAVGQSMLKGMEGKLEGAGSTLWGRDGRGESGQQRYYLAIGFAGEMLLAGPRQQGNEFGQHWINGPRVQDPAPHSP